MIKPFPSDRVGKTIKAKKGEKMSKIDSGGNAFPYCVWVGDHHNGHNTGMTKREYSAINLRVPNSGTEWLDEMIRASLHNEFAGMAMHGLLANPSVILKQTDIPELSFEYADSMIRAGKGKNSNG